MKTFLELRREKEFMIEEKRQLSEASQIQKICMGFAMLASADARKSFRAMPANCSSTEYEEDSNKTIFVIFILYY